ncbi:MAG: FG-GAP repeat protein [Candidatus Sumerlaeia bacterium]|nr:FG-GAP repeat protein [Candidatus Sumerlaeia bacterium]
MSIPKFANRAPVPAVAALLALALGGLAPAQLTHPFRVDGLDGANGVRLNVRGMTSDGWGPQSLGHPLVGIGDINGDGFEDFAVSMSYTVWIPVYPWGSTPERVGRVYVVLGRAGDWPQGVMSLGDLGPGQAIQIGGRTRLSSIGTSLAGAGDVNGDGYADFLARAGGSSQFATDMAVYLFFGHPDFASPFSLDSLDGHNVVRFHWGDSSTSAGIACGGIGDVNGDGFDDIYIPESSEFGNKYGSIVYGSPESWPTETYLPDLSLGTQRTVVVNALAFSQPAIAGLGDVNGDGVDDFALGFPDASTTGGDGAGAVYVIYGRPGGFGDELDLAALDGKNGFRLDGDFPGERLASAVPVGDIFANGRNNFLAGALWFGNDGITSRGRAVLFGLDSMPEGVFPAVSGANDAAICQFWGADRSDCLGSTGVWGYDHDGLPRWIIGASGAGQPADTWGYGHGSAYLFRYNLELHGCPFDLADFDDRHGIRLDGINIGDRFGGGIASGFDFNGDGLFDAVLTSDRAYDYEGEINLVYGFDGPTSLTLRRYVAPGNPPTAGVGMLGNGSHTIPHSRLWITFGSGDDGSGGASLVTVTVNRTADGLTNLPGPAADVQWIGDWDRPGWDGAYITVKYLDSEVAGLAPTRLRLFYSESPDGPWTQSEHGFVDTRRKRIGGVVWSKGYYVLAESSPPTGDVNRDGAVTPLDAQWAFECALAACPPDADIEAGDLCPPYDVLTPADSQGIFHRFLDLAECP